VTLEQELQGWLKEHTGLELSRGGIGQVLHQVVERRCSELGCGADDYLVRLRQPDGAEFELLANEVTVVYTWFFRDPGQLAGVEEVMRGWVETRPVRVWVPGCATGEDVYSVSLIAQRLGVEARILGTDLNTRALQAAKKGEYSARDLRGLDADTRQHFTARANGRFGLSESILRRVSFLRHNLVDGFPSLDGDAGWDVILCRNVFIYFEAQRALEVFHRLTRALTPGGYLLLGASEIVYEVPEGVRAVRLAQRLALQRCEVKRDVRTPSIAPSVRRTVPPPRPNIGPGLLMPSLPPSLDAERNGQPLAERSMPKGEVSEGAAALQRGHELLGESRLAEALDCYEAAVRADRTNGDALMHRGIVRYLRGEVDAAAKDLRAALFLDDGLWVGCFYLALSYESMGLDVDARREYQRLVGLTDRENATRSSDGPELWAGWRQDIVRLARHRLERARPVAAPGQRP
jgi:chemotaxis protein methyltransferase CheR